MNIGSIWHRWDLHYHTPSSYDYKNKAKTNEVLVQELLDDGVSGVAVTDHHVIDFGRINSLNTTILYFSISRIIITKNRDIVKQSTFVCLRNPYQSVIIEKGCRTKQSNQNCIKFRNPSTMAGETRFEHATDGFGDRYSTVEPLP